jgi:peptide/nickel transport system permease protein
MRNSSGRSGQAKVLDVIELKPSQSRQSHGMVLMWFRRMLRWWPIAIVSIAAVAAAFPSILSPQDPNLIHLGARLVKPGTTSGGTHFVFGSDELGRDVLSRVIWGARTSVIVALVAVFFSGLVGGSLGVLAGVRPKFLGVAIMRFADLVLSVPFFLLAILVVAVLGASVVNEVIVLALVRWPRYTRVAYGQTIETSNREFVRSAVALGARQTRVVFRHILPEVLPSLVVVATLEVGLMIIFEAALSFIGLGPPPPAPSWGSMLSDGQQYVATAWWISTFPGVALFLVVIAVNKIGDRVRDRLDPRSRKTGL